MSQREGVESALRTACWETCVLPRAVGVGGQQDLRRNVKMSKVGSLL